jgi:hypothetical protein
MLVHFLFAFTGGNNAVAMENDTMGTGSIQ